MADLENLAVYLHYDLAVLETFQGSGERLAVFALRNRTVSLYLDLLTGVLQEMPGGAEQAIQPRARDFEIISACERVFQKASDKPLASLLIALAGGVSRVEDSCGAQHRCDREGLHV